MKGKYIGMAEFAYPSVGLHVTRKALLGDGVSTYMYVWSTMHSIGAVGDNKTRYLSTSFSTIPNILPSPTS